MEKLTEEEKRLMSMDIYDSYQEVDLRYVSILTYRFYGLPGCEEDYMWEIILRDFWGRYMRGDIRHPFSKIDYLNNDRYSGIRKTVQAYGLDVEMFWYLLLFIYDYVSEKLSEGGHITDLSLTAFANNLIDQIRDSKLDEIEITIKNKGKNIPISAAGKHSIIKMIHAGYDHLYKNAIMYEINISYLNNNIAYYSESYRMKKAVELYNYAFDYLEKSWNMIHRKKTAGVSLNKMLLFSRIMHLYHWTNNENFLCDDSSLRGILKAYKNKRIEETYSMTYL